jgi:hypothetical protein
MRSTVFATGLILALVLTAAPAAQFRGKLTSRPSIPSAGPRSSATPVPVPPSALPIHRRSRAAPLRPLLLWPWAVATLPEIAFGQAPIGEGAPNGGVQLDFEPWSAEVYVDGARAGRVEQFRGYYQHLALPAGPHTIAIVAAGYEPFIFAVMVLPGKTLTYRATLQR